MTKIRYTASAGLPGYLPYTSVSFTDAMEAWQFLHDEFVDTWGDYEPEPGDPVDALDACYADFLLKFERMVASPSLSATIWTPRPGCLDTDPHDQGLNWSVEVAS
jgi:hypothetical protein